MADLRNSSNNKSLSLSGYYWGYVYPKFYMRINNLSDELMPGEPIPTDFTVSKLDNHIQNSDLN